MGAKKFFRHGFRRLTPRREYIYHNESGYYQDGWYGSAKYKSLGEYNRRKWSRIRKLCKRRKKPVERRKLARVYKYIGK